MRVARVPAALAALLAMMLVVTAGYARAATATVTSFDGTRIHVNFFPAAGLAPGGRAPTVMFGPGWGQPGDTNENDSTDVTTGIPGIGTLRAAGFNVLTWDPRGFGSSGGTVEVDSPQYEGRDVSAMITWLSRQPQALLDRPGDPRVGMAGGSYGGGIQLVAAAIDPRIDAIVPDIAWHSLVTSLFKEQTPKLGWASLLYNLGKLVGRLDPMLGESYQTAVAELPATPAQLNFYESRGPGALVSRIHVPTLLIQGTVDNLFTLQEAVTNYEILRRDGVPVKMLWFCGGHGVCITNPGQTSLIAHDTIAWLDRYLKRDSGVRTGPTFEWVDQNGVEHTAADYPLAAAPQIIGGGSGTLPLLATGGAGPLVPPAGAGLIASVAAPITPAKATNALDVTLPSPSHKELVLGPPRLTITYKATGTGVNGPSTRVYAQIVDDSTGKPLGNQITPVPITIDGATHTSTEPLEILSATDSPGEKFTLQLTPSTVLYELQRGTGTVTFSHIRIQLPTVDLNARPPGYGPIGPSGCTGSGTVVLPLPRGAVSAEAKLGGRVLARGRRLLRIDLMGLGSRTVEVRIRIIIRGAGGSARTFVRRYRACP